MPERDLLGDVPKQWRGKGYAATPGSGPAGSTCGDCIFATLSDYHNRRYWKCRIGNLSRGSATDIRKSAPACWKFKEAEIE